MLVTLGACGASLVWLGLWPALARRTERLARRRVEATLPMSVSEFASERDQLRAAFAVKEARIEKQAEALATRHAEMVAEVGRANARLAVLEESHAAATRRESELIAEGEELKMALAERMTAFETQQGAHGSAQEQAAALDLAYRKLLAEHESLSDAAEQRRVEFAALQAEREALLGRLEGVEAAHKSLRAEYSALSESVDAGKMRSAVLGAERESHVGEKLRLESEVGLRAERIAALEERLRDSGTERIHAEARASDLGTRLAASDAHGARLALDLEAARERIASLASLHQSAQRQAADATSELAMLEQKLGTESERAEQAEAAERLHVANAVAELRKLELELEGERTRLGAATGSLEEARSERDRLQAEVAKLSARRPPKEAMIRQETASGEDQAARQELVAMIERLADNIAQASGAEPLPPVARERVAEPAQPAAAE